MEEFIITPATFDEVIEKAVEHGWDNPYYPETDYESEQMYDAAVEWLKERVNVREWTEEEKYQFYVDAYGEEYAKSYLNLQD